jgi:ABC-type anion transport system duplicated permease subunit
MKRHMTIFPKSAYGLDSRNVNLSNLFQGLYTMPNDLNAVVKRYFKLITFHQCRIPYIKPHILYIIKA